MLEISDLESRGIVLFHVAKTKALISFALDKTALEWLQNEAARIVTGLTKSTSLVNLYKECGWDSLSKRRYFQKMCFMYKCSNNIVPDYISDIVPPLVGEVTNYPLRNRHNIASMYTRTEISPKLAFPHLYLAGIILIITLESLTAMSPFAAHLRMRFEAMPKFPPIS